MHQVGPPAQQIAHRPQLRIVDVRLGQNVQPLQFGQVKGVMLVVGVLDPAVLLDLRRVGQVDRIALRAASHPPANTS